ncbi:MAG: hypothetical protein HKN73_04095 [Gemmatimonadetes bacterium]|nr:hypothetical protein [Gemmatimonadota bacterium]
MQFLLVDDQEDIIDLVPYLDAGRVERDSFSVYGGADSASRLALPVWRSVYRLRGSRGAVVAVQGRSRSVRTIFVLDLGADPARTDVPGGVSALPRRAETGGRLTVSRDEGWAAVYVGQKGGECFYLVALDVDDLSVVEDEKVRQDVLFLAGECASLVLHWGLDRPFGRRPAAGSDRGGARPS